MISRRAEVDLLAIANESGTGSTSKVCPPSPSSVHASSSSSRIITPLRTLQPPPRKKSRLTFVDDAVGLDLDTLGIPPSPKSPVSIADYPHLCIASAFDERSEPFRLLPRRSSISSHIEFPVLS
mmetsp:Transcript_1376/g.2948  ORF Transcript_1376/g.2948 Transcript_1376/m.2948 type:complete len:124 (-) Transcript_1376:434-805(-)